jgi:hypothetical protein
MNLSIQQNSYKDASQPQQQEYPLDKKRLSNVPVMQRPEVVAGEVKRQARQMHLRKKGGRNNHKANASLVSAKYKFHFSLFNGGGQDSHHSSAARVGKLAENFIGGSSVLAGDSQLHIRKASQFTSGGGIRKPTHSRAKTAKGGMRALL